MRTETGMGSARSEIANMTADFAEEDGDLFLSPSEEAELVGELAEGK